jgi:quercetin 2,3-dioxygenase
MQIRKSADRGHVNHGWLDSYHSFSFGHYHDKDWMGYSVLRVINEDVIAPAQGFGMHSHQDMEIITYILQGELSHKDSLGNVEIIHQGHVQRMTAGTGITHSEFNASNDTPVHLLQIWILPNQLDLTPSYEDGFFTDEQKQNQWCLLVSEKGENNSLIVHQDMALYAAKLSEHEQLTYQLDAKRCAYLQVATGSVELNGQLLDAGDAVMLADNEAIVIKALHTAEILLFDLPQ